eukprot:117510_1
MSTNLQCDKCTINDCYSLQNIITATTKYETWLYDENDKIDNPFLSILNNISSKKDILNYYDHIKTRRYSLDSKCEAESKCVPIQRHKRNNKKPFNKKYFTHDINEIITQKIFDKIHIFLYHQLNNDNDNNNSRFVTNIAQPKQYKHFDDIVDNEQKHDFNLNVHHNQHDLEKDAYSFGQQFFYWDYYKNNKWFVTKTYDNFKQELLNNYICNIEAEEFNLQYAIAVDYLNNDERVQKLRANDAFTNIYNIIQNTSITLLQILFSLSRELVR